MPSTLVYPDPSTTSAVAAVAAAATAAGATGSPGTAQRKRPFKLSKTVWPVPSLSQVAAFVTVESLAFCVFG